MFVTTGSLTVYTQYLKKVVLAACLALALVAGVGATAHPVGAMPIDSGSAGCAIIAGRINDLIAEYGRVARANPNDPQLDAILAQLRDAGRDWKAIGCYGSPLAARTSVGQFGGVALASGNTQAVALPSPQKTGISQSELPASGNMQAVALP